MQSFRIKPLKYLDITSYFILQISPFIRIQENKSYIKLRLILKYHTLWCIDDMTVPCYTRVMKSDRWELAKWKSDPSQTVQVVGCTPVTI